MKTDSATARLTAKEWKAQRETTTLIDSYDYRNENDEDDYVVAALYRTKDRRYIRYIESSGMNSKYSGAGDFCEWLPTKTGWKKF